MASSAPSRPSTGSAPAVTREQDDWLAETAHRHGEDLPEARHGAAVRAHDAPRVHRPDRARRRLAGADGGARRPDHRAARCPSTPACAVGRNAAIAAATTPYVMVTDDDVVMTAGTDLAGAVAFLEEHPDVDGICATLIELPRWYTWPYGDERELFPGHRPPLRPYGDDGRRAAGGDEGPPGLRRPHRPAARGALRREHPDGRPPRLLQLGLGTPRVRQRPAAGRVPCAHAVRHDVQLLPRGRGAKTCPTSPGSGWARP